MISILVILGIIVFVVLGFYSIHKENEAYWEKYLEQQEAEHDVRMKSYEHSLQSYDGISLDILDSVEVTDDTEGATDD